MSDPRAQSNFQLRLGWGVEGLRRLAQSRIVVVIDAIGTDPTQSDAAAPSGGAALLAQRAAELPHRPIVFIASLRNATATAQAIYEEQLAAGGRAAINLVLVGDDGYFAVEDYLAAGAIGDALSALGLDHTSPELAVATEGFRPLGRALKHLLSASGSGMALKEADRRDEVVAAAEFDAEATARRVDDATR